MTLVPAAKTGRVPVLEIAVPDALALSARLQRGDPPVHLSERHAARGVLTLDPQVLLPEHDAPLAAAIRAQFKSRRLTSGLQTGQQRQFAPSGLWLQSHTSPGDDHVAAAHGRGHAMRSVPSCGIVLCRATNHKSGVRRHEVSEILAVMTALAFGLPLAATAQQSVAKGSALGYQVLRRDWPRPTRACFPRRRGWHASDVVLLSRCDTDTQATIAALEHKLKDKKIDLPSDGRVAQPPGSTGNTQ